PNLRCSSPPGCNGIFRMDRWGLSNYQRRFSSITVAKLAFPPLPGFRYHTRVKLFPLFLKLENRPCLVVGAGCIAEGTIVGLLDTGAHLQVVAPEATVQIQAWAQEKKLA